ncbi:DNA-binding protein P3A2-like [Amphiura filiformis]|uniref:DNA-binding protein P3A2-like n=1 Tax=Amphiura filiformis TaxID=82378 RepID=UPI003B2155C1
MMISDQDHDQDGDVSPPSSPDTPFDESDLLSTSCTDDVTAQLVAAGPIGIAAAAAIATGKKRKRPHTFETNPSIRKRQQTRLIRKLKNTIDEYTTRVGQQAVVVCCTPGKQDSYFKVFGAAPLENVVRSVKSVIIGELENALSQQAMAPPIENPNLYELPPLLIDGIPVPVDQMTQAQLRAFIPLMLKYSTGRGKPGWGKESCRPVWWPSDLPWANVRSDVRTEDERRRVSWTHALRTIVKNCYKHHGREDLLPIFGPDSKDMKEEGQHVTIAASQHATLLPSHTVVQTINNPDGTVSLIQVDTGNTVATLTADVASQFQKSTAGRGDTQYIQMVQHVQQVAQMPQVQQIQLSQIPMQTQQQEATQAVQTLAEVAAATQGETVTSLPQAPQATPVDMNTSEAAAQAVATLAEATLSDGAQIMLSGDGQTMGTITGVQDGQSIVIPSSMYQTIVTSMPDAQVITSNASIGGQQVQIVRAGPHQTVQVTNGGAQALEFKQGGHQTVQVTNTSGQVIESCIVDAHGQPVQIVTAGPDQTVQATNDGQTIDFKNEQTSVASIVPTATQAVEVVAMETETSQTQSQQDS